jgi:hypothetical protein
VITASRAEPIAAVPGEVEASALDAVVPVVLPDVLTGLVDEQGVVAASGRLVHAAGRAHVGCGASKGGPQTLALVAPPPTRLTVRSGHRARVEGVVSASAGVVRAAPSGTDAR